MPNSRQLPEQWERVFRTLDYYTDPFRDPLSLEALFFPVAGYHLTESQYRAVVAGARALGDDEVVVSHIAAREPEQQGTDFWVMPSDSDYQFYRNTPVLMDNTLHARSGLWGVVITDEEHALVGSEGSFGEVVRRRYPDSRLDASRLVDYWRQRDEDVLSRIRRLVEELPGIE